MSLDRVQAGLAFLALLLISGTLPGQPAPASPESSAVVAVIVPADAELLFDGIATSQKGTTRSFTTPPLKVGRIFHYNIVARWKAAGKPVEQKREVNVTAGARVLVDFVKAQETVAAPAEPRIDQAAADDKQVVESKSAPRPAAASVNFRKQLGLPYPTLRTLGSRIDTARRTHDAVGLANAAAELAGAEKLSGKQAGLTSSALMNEAAGAGQPQAARKRAAGGFERLESGHDGPGQHREHAQVLAMAQAQAKADTEAFQQGQEPTWTPRKVIVNNYTTQYMDVYVNGNFKVTVLPGQTQAFLIEHRWNPTVLTAYGDEDAGYPWKRIINGRFTTYTWNLN